MRLIFLALASLPLFACGPGTAEATTDAASSTTAAGSDASSSGTTATTATTSASTAGTDEPTTTVGTTATATATATATTATTGEPDTTTSGGPGTSTTTTTDSSTDTGVGAVCESDADCKLADDCCDCFGVPVDADVAVCDMECKQSRCSELGIKMAVCHLGVCTTPRLSCDASKVACDSLPPPCEPGTVAETTPACWSGRCVPAKYCDVVESCEQCPEGLVCVQNIGLAPEPGVICEPLPANCDPAKPCACIGDQVCQDPFGFCTDQPGGDIGCECPNC